MVGGLDCRAGPQTANIAQIPGLPGAFPDMVIVVAGKKENVLLEKSFTIRRKDEFNEALEDHGGLIDIGQSHFEDIAIEDECGLFRAFVARDKLPQTDRQLTQNRAGARGISFDTPRLDGGQYTIIRAEVHI